MCCASLKDAQAQLYNVKVKKQHKHAFFPFHLKTEIYYDISIVSFLALSAFDLKLNSYYKLLV